MKILFVLTSHDQLGDTGHKTGFWLEEFAAPYYVFRDGGAEVVSMGSHGIYTAAEVGTLEPSRVVDMVTAADHPDAEAVLVPDTAMHTLAIIDQLEAAVGKPVLTANQVTVWKGLELLGPVPELPGLGALFRSGSRR